MAVLAALVLPACGFTTHRTNPFANLARTIEVRVVNNHFSDVTVHISGAALRQRVGYVTGKTEETFEVVWPQSRVAQMEMDFVAGPRCRTERLQVDPGDRLSLIIPSTLYGMGCGGP